MNKAEARRVLRAGEELEAAIVRYCGKIPFSELEKPTGLRATMLVDTLRARDLELRRELR